MNYEKIILELFGRIQELEAKAELLDQRLAKVEGAENLHYGYDNDSNVDENDGEKITRSEARVKAIARIKDWYNEPDCLVYPAKRDEGSGIRVDRHHEDGDHYLIKFYHSKTSLRQYGKYESGLHVVGEDEVESLHRGSHFAIYLFSMVDSQEQWHYFMFTQQELLNFILEDRKEQGVNLLRLQFSVQDGRAYELYDKDNKIDITDKHYNNWDILERVHGIKP